MARNPRDEVVPRFVADWIVRYEMHTDLDIENDEHAGLAAAGGVRSVQFTNNPAGGQWCTVTIGIAAHDHTEANRVARQLYAIAAARVSNISPPYRVTAERVDAPTGHDLLSTAAVAQRLGVSDARVRQLAARPDFPRPLSIPGLAGAVYSTASIDVWAATWDRDAKGGRPRKPDD